MYFVVHTGAVFSQFPSKKKSRRPIKHPFISDKEDSVSTREVTRIVCDNYAARRGVKHAARRGVNYAARRGVNYAARRGVRYLDWTEFEFRLLYSGCVTIVSPRSSWILITLWDLQNVPTLKAKCLLWGRQYQQGKYSQYQQGKYSQYQQGKYSLQISCSFRLSG